MGLLQDLLNEIYNTVTLPILKFIANTPVYFAKFILFLVIITFGYIIGRFVDFIIKIVLSYIRLDEYLKEKRLENILFGVKPSNFIRGLIRYYIYLYFIALGLGSFGVNLSLSLNYLNMLYIILVITSIGSAISGVIEVLLRGITDKETVIMLSKGLIIYVFFVWALEIVGLPTSIFQLILNIFLISIAISLGISLGVLMVLENREAIRKIFQK